MTPVADPLNLAPDDLESVASSLLSMAGIVPGVPATAPVEASGRPTGLPEASATTAGTPETRVATAAPAPLSTPGPFGQQSGTAIPDFHSGSPVPPAEELLADQPASPPFAPMGAEPNFYFLPNAGSHPGAGVPGPGRPLSGEPEGLPHSEMFLPGSELERFGTSQITHGIDPLRVSPDLLEFRPGGRDVPLGVPPMTPVGASKPQPAAHAGADAPSADMQSPGGGAGVPETGVQHDEGRIGSAILDGRDPGLVFPFADDPVTGHAPTGAAPSGGATDYYFLQPRGGSAQRESSSSSGRGPLIRDDFPILSQRVNGHRLVWLDSAATTQKPNAVIDGEAEFYRTDNSNVHRGAHSLARRATDAYEHAREKAQRFLGAGSSDEIIFVRGTTEGINLIANAYAKQIVRPGDEILITHLEHHSNIVPWQMLCQATGAILRAAPVDDRGEVQIDAFERLLSPRTKIVSLTQVSNVTGTLVPVAALAAMAHQHNARVIVDGAQAIAHVPCDVKALDADFYVFSGHKIYGPTGIGVVYGKKALLEEMKPWQGGGSMITDVTIEQSIYAPPPAKFEAGTGNIAGAVGLGLALDYLDRLGRPTVAMREEVLTRYGLEALQTIPGLKMVGSPNVRVGALSFVIDGQDPIAVAKALDKRGIAVRAGHHCAQPIHRRFGLEASIRASLGVYNEADDIDALVTALRELDRSQPPPPTAK